MRAKTERFESDALLVRRVPMGEADLVVTFFTETRGVWAAIARSARKSTKRFASLEPMHLLRVAIDERPGAELGTLVDASLVRPRLGLSAKLELLEAAGHALRWVRKAAPPHEPEPELWLVLNELLDALETAEAIDADRHLAAMGMRALSALGWGLDLSRCVRCGRDCAPGASAYVDPAQGGLCCRACGGGPILLRADRRARLLALEAGDANEGELQRDDARAVIELVEAAIAAHVA